MVGTEGTTGASVTDPDPPESAPFLRIRILSVFSTTIQNQFEWDCPEKTKEGRKWQVSIARFKGTGTRDLIWLKVVSLERS